MKYNKEYKIKLCPSNIDVASLIIKYSYKFNYNNSNRQKQKEQFLTVIDRLVKARYHRQVELDNFDSRIEFPVCMEVLRDNLREAIRYLDILGEEGLLFSDGISKTSKCSSYQFVNDQDHEVIDEVVIFPQKLKASLQKKTIAKQKRKESELPYQYILADYKKLTVDWETADEIIGEIYKDTDNRHLMVAKNLQLEYLAMIDEGETSMWKILSTGRLSNAFAYLKKELRSSLRYEGQPLIELDVKNSIPFCSLMLFDTDTHDDSAKNKLVYNIIKGIEDRGYKINSNSYIYHMQAKKRLQNSPSVIAYIKDVLNGEIYENVNREWSKELGTNYSRGEAKKRLISLFNSPNHLVDSEPHWLVFEKMYPSVAEYIYGLNKGFTKLKKHSSKDDLKCAFAYLTQGIEKYLLLDVIVPKIKSIHPNTPLITLHDGIYTIDKYQGKVYSIMLECYDEIIGHKPKIAIKSCKPSK